MTESVADVYHAKMIFVVVEANLRSPLHQVSVLHGQAGDGHHVVLHSHPLCLGDQGVGTQATPPLPLLAGGWLVL